ncbi:hypothetical protein GWK47_002427 [Chionoecetes opilio]|uniref:Uncharacterized protein n=1 Tax=Chionoecetes opilio TaxID=41210 RepID=A0A8J5BV69_CHIOP|nr:hypothetical protein GWK47_002427 [Chionoecetes opilio]
MRQFSPHWSKVVLPSTTNSSQHNSGEASQTHALMTTGLPGYPAAFAPFEYLAYTSSPSFAVNLSIPPISVCILSDDILDNTYEYTSSEDGALE